MTLACGDSHTATHGAFGALAYGIGTSEVEHVLATQTLIQTKSKNMRAVVDGKLPPGVTAKDIILAIIGEIGTAGVHRLCARICRRDHPFAVDGRAHDGVQHVGRGRRQVRLHRARCQGVQLCEGSPQVAEGQGLGRGRALLGDAASDDDAHFDREIRLDAAKLPPLVTWGTSPEQVVSVTGRVPRIEDIADAHKREAAERSLAYMGLQGGEKIADIALDRVFIGSCTNGRIEDLRAAARVVDGKKVHASVSAMIVPGSGLVKEQAEAEGLDQIFLKAGFEWREPGCSMCLAMNPDKLNPGERCASTSNRNFEGRQGYKGRTHLVSPAMAAAAAIAGHFVDVREWH